jgi:hypothetical protein
MQRKLAVTLIFELKDESFKEEGIEDEGRRKIFLLQVAAQTKLTEAEVLSC